METSTLYKERGVALKGINGDHDESYAFLPKYVGMIRRTNPKSRAHCGWIQGQGPEKPLLFSSISMSFKGCIDGVASGCRSLIEEGSAHLKGNFGGVFFYLQWQLMLTIRDGRWV